MAEPMMNPEPEDADSPEEIVCIEYSDGHPHSVLTDCHRHRDKTEGHSHQHYDFDWHKGGSELYFHLSGGGPACAINIGLAATPDPPPFSIWVKPGLALTQTAQVDGLADWIDIALPRDSLLARGFVLLDEPLDLGSGERNPFVVGVEGETIYCAKCVDHLPTGYDDPCKHVTWCDECGGYVYESVHHASIDNTDVDGKPTIHEGVKDE